MDSYMRVCGSDQIQYIVIWSDNVQLHKSTKSMVNNKYIETLPTVC